MGCSPSLGARGGESSRTDIETVWTYIHRCNLSVSDSTTPVGRVARENWGYQLFNEGFNSSAGKHASTGRGEASFLLPIV